MRKIIILVLLLLLFSQVVFSQVFSNNLSPRDEYFLLLSDLANTHTNGYKSYLYIDIKGITSRVTKNIDFSQGSLLHTNRELDFAIIGEGFFKIILDNGSIAYTRNGEFMIEEKTNELVTINGRYRLFDTIKIEPSFTKIIFNKDHSIITIYSDGKEINNGFLNIYTLDNNKLKSLNNNNVIFEYNGNEENIGDGKIYHKFIEQSNVSIVSLMVRLIYIGKKLGINL